MDYTVRRRILPAVFNHFKGLRKAPREAENTSAKRNYAKPLIIDYFSWRSPRQGHAERQENPNIFLAILSVFKSLSLAAASACQPSQEAATSGPRLPAAKGGLEARGPKGAPFPMNASRRSEPSSFVQRIVEILPVFSEKSNFWRTLQLQPRDRDQRGG